MGAGISSLWNAKKNDLTTFAKRSYITPAMQAEPRHYRAYVANRSRNRPPLSEKQKEQREHIIANAQGLMASFAGGRFTIGSLARALQMSPGTIHRHFPDIESVLAEILFRHLIEVTRAINKIPQDHPNRRPAARAAYIEATRTYWGSLTEAHLLLVRTRHTLPDDLAKPIEDMRTMIGETLAGENAEAAFTLLDSPYYEAKQIEAILAPSEAKAQDPKPAAPAKPAAPPAPAEAPPAHKRHFRDWKLEKRLQSAMKQQARAGPAEHPGNDPPK